MSSVEDALAAVRNRPEYRAGIWSFRVMLVMAAVLLPNIALSFLPGWTVWLLWVAYLAVVLYGYRQFGRAGVHLKGTSKEVWSRRGMVYRDVLGLGQR